MTDAYKTSFLTADVKVIDIMLPWVYSVVHQRICQNVEGTSVTHSAAPPMPIFCRSKIIVFHECHL